MPTYPIHTKIVHRPVNRQDIQMNFLPLEDVSRWRDPQLVD